MEPQEPQGQFKPWEKRVGLALLALVAVVAAISFVKPERAKPEGLQQAWEQVVYGQAVVPAVEVRDIGPAPVLTKAKPVKRNGKLMAAWSATGAGDASYDGLYSPVGTHNGQPYYQNPGGRLLWMNSIGTSWQLSDVFESDPNSPYFGGETLPANPWSASPGFVPAPTLAAGSWIHLGASDADSLLWDVAANVRQSKYSATVGGTLYDPAFGQGGTDFQYRAPVLTGGDTYTATLKIGGHTWATSTGLPGHATNTLDGVWSGGLPYSDGVDSWETWLGAAGAKTLTIELRKASDGTLVASDTAAYTQFIPAIVLATDPAVMVSDIFDVTVSFDECYYLYPGETYEHLYLFIEYDGTEYGFGVAVDGMSLGGQGVWMVAGAATTVSMDLLRVGTVSSGNFNYYGTNGLPPGIFTLRARLAPLIDEDVALSHAETYTVTITAPSAGAVLLSGNNDVLWAIPNGWYAYSSFKVYALRGGVWTEVATAALQALPTRTGYSASPQFDTTDSAIKVEWGYLSGSNWIVLDSDIIAITVEAASDDGGLGGGGDEEGGGGGGGGGTSPWVNFYFPASGATVDTTFTGYLSYGNFAATPAGTLQIVAVGATDTVTLYNATVTLAAAGGQFVLALDFGAVADGAYSIFASLTGADPDTAADATSLILAAGGSGDTTDPVVTITAPLTGASVSGNVAVIATATDNVAVWRVSFTADDATPQYLYAPTSGADTYAFTWASSTYTNGSHTLRVTARDADGNTASDSVTVNLANAQADTIKYLFTKPLGFTAHAAINAESANWRDRTLLRSIEILELPAAADLPADPRQRYNLFVGYNVPGTSVDFDDYRLVTPGQSHTLTPAGTSIRWGIKAVPQRSLTEWTVTCANMIRLALSTDAAYVFALCTTPHSLRRITLATGYDEEWADLSHLTTAPTDMAVCGGKVFVNSADRLEVVDETTDDLSFQMLLPSPDEVTSVDALASDGTTVYVAATLAAGGSRLYGFTYDAPEELCDHAHPITALAVLGGVVYVGNDQGEVLTYAANALTLAYATGEASVVRFALVGDTVYAGTSTSGKVFRKVAGWGEGWDAGFTAAKGLASLAGYAYAGGTGTGGAYLWYEQTADGWVQTQLLTNALAVNDLLTASYKDADQLFVGCTGNGATSYIYRLELSPASDFVCDTEPPDLQFKIIRD